MREFIARCENAVTVSEPFGTRCPKQCPLGHDFLVRSHTHGRRQFAFRENFWRFAMVHSAENGLHCTAIEQGVPATPDAACPGFPMRESVRIIGGGLAGSEAAWQLAERGHDVVVHEMRPTRATPAHKTDRLAELVCSNTFKSTQTTNAHRPLQNEKRGPGSPLLQAAPAPRRPRRAAVY